MPTVLGSAFAPKPTVEPDLDPLTDLALLTAVQGLTETVAHLRLPPPVVNLPAPQVRVDAPPAGPTAAEIGAAVAKALPADDDGPLLLAVAGVREAVDKLAKKTTAPRFGTAGGLGGAVFETTGELRVSAQDSAKVTRYDWQVAGGVSVPLYVGTATPGTVPSAVGWRIEKYTYITGPAGDAVPSLIEAATGAWDTRASLFP